MRRGQQDSAVLDGRRARWTEHGRVRREELIHAAFEAVRQAGPGFAVDDVARSAGVSERVIYRCFTDKVALVDAVLDRIVGAILLPRLLGELEVERSDDRARLGAVITAFIRLSGEEPSLYHFSYAGAPAGPTRWQPSSGRWSRPWPPSWSSGCGRPAEPTTTWAYGVVGMVRSLPTGGPPPTTCPPPTWSNR